MLKAEGSIIFFPGTVSGVSDVPTVTANLHSQGTISSQVLGVSFVPPTSDSDENGSISWGG